MGADFTGDFPASAVPLTDDDVLYEDNHLIAICKKGGQIVQEDKSGDKPLSALVYDYLKVKYNKPGDVFVGVVHRLDRPVSGVILFAKTSKGLHRMNDMFKQREIRKTYWAMVRKHPVPESGKLVHWLVKDPETNVTTAYAEEVENGMRSELSYKMIKEIGGYFLIEVNPLTGRPHQIRVQLSTLGCPIVGDNKYGYPRGSRRRTIALHARKLEFLHPVKKEPVSITARTPRDGFWEKYV
ncbi:MAG: RluA family pseudouridine synthase [Mucilaginibacter polytrichastri]|nr:RluA family pseudouridine synthase [Mucilaginibacter polytrichastri]